MDFHKAKHDLLDLAQPELMLSGSVNPGMYEFVTSALPHLRTCVVAGAPT